MALIRYPGSKQKLVGEILSRFPDAMKLELWSDTMQWEYREPFFGAGAVGFRVLRKLSRQCPIWLNDADRGIVGLWRAIKDETEGLITRLSRFTPSAEWFFKFKDEDGKYAGMEEAQIGFRKLALHRMSFSGLGAMAGGPIGGQNQTNPKYDVACRWNPETIKQEARTLGRRLRRFSKCRISCGDFAPLIETAGAKCFIYADPPYVEKGGQLYKHNMSEADHARLAKLLRQTDATWVCSYDDHPLVHELYGDWARIEPVFITYTTAKTTNGRRPKNREILISPRQC